jgi:transposase-like protein
MFDDACEQLMAELVARAHADGGDLVRPVDIDVPRDRDGSFDPETVKKRQSSSAVWTRWSSRCAPKG